MSDRLDEGKKSDEGNTDLDATLVMNVVRD